MSAIFGMVNLQKNGIMNDCYSKMAQPYLSYKIDRYENIMRDNVMMGCGIQYITRESHEEQLPYYDAERQLYFTADCFVDNRNELIKTLGVPDSMSDGMILYQAYIKWKEKCVDHVLGSFAFAVYDAGKNEITLFTDHTGSRCLFYSYNRENGDFIFSTLTESILSFAPGERVIDDEWVYGFITGISPIVNLYPEKTVYRGIRRMKAAFYVKAGETTVSEERYWDPTKSYQIRKISNDKAKKEFLALIRPVCENILRTDGEVGEFLSSGLDSTSIAAICAPILEKQGKKLYGFTSVAVDSYKAESVYDIPDESEGVMELCNMYKNIVPDFESFSDKDDYTEAVELLRILETPTKSHNNTVWENEFYKRAANQKCRIMLNAQTGNTSVSAGNAEDYFYYLLSKFKLRIFYHETMAFCRRLGISRRKFYKVFAQKTFRQFFVKQRVTDYDAYKDTCTNRNGAEKVELSKKLVQNKRNFFTSTFSSLQDIKSMVFMPLCFAQVGEVQTKMGLKYGILERDPYATKTVIEWCVSLPFSCFVSNGCDRFLIRNTFKNLIPESIRCRMIKRGVQGADYYYRAQRTWENRSEDIYQTIINSGLRRYIDVELLNDMFESINSNGTEQEGQDLLVVMNLYAMAEFFSI